MAAPQYNTGFNDAESVNNSSQSTFIYKDLSLFFNRNPVTSDVATVTDVQDIKRAVKHINALVKADKAKRKEKKSTKLKKDGKYTYVKSPK